MSDQSPQKIDLGFTVCLAVKNVLVFKWTNIKINLSYFYKVSLCTSFILVYFLIENQHLQNMSKITY